MKTIQKWLCAFLALFAVLLLMAACENTATPTQPTGNEADPTDPVVKDENAIYLIGPEIAGKSDYSLVYSEDDENAREQALLLRDAFLEVGVRIRVVSDERDQEGKEIRMGKTNRVSAWEERPGYKTAWIDRDEAGNLTVSGNLRYGAQALAEYVRSLGTDTVSPMPESLFGAYLPQGVAEAPEYTGSGTVAHFDSYEESGSHYLIITGATRQDYADYTAMLATKGYTCFYQTQPNGNLFETWTDGATILTLSHIAYRDVATIDYKTESLGDVMYMSISVDTVEKSALPARQADRTGAVAVQLTAVDTACGYVVRLSDGRFLVFDGGMPDQARTIYDILTQQNELEGEPVVAAWFLTHGHVDHIGAINKFMERYYDRVKVETFVHHLPGYAIYNGKNTVEKQPEEVAEDLLTRSILYYASIGTYYPDAQIVVAHAGQRFEYGSIGVDVLFTTENIYQKQMYDTNMSSVIYSLEGPGGRMILLGDAQDIQCPTLNCIYGSSLKCDLVQVAHHGYNGGNAEMYKSMGAKYAIWPNSYEIVMERKLHIASATPRNKFSYKTVTYNLIPHTGDDWIVLREDMAASELKVYDAKLTG